MNDLSSVNNLNFSPQTSQNLTESKKNNKNNTIESLKTSSANISTKNLIIESKQNFVDSLIDLPINFKQTNNNKLIQKNFQLPDLDSIKG